MTTESKPPSPTATIDRAQQAAFIFTSCTGVLLGTETLLARLTGRSATPWVRRADRVIFRLNMFGGIAMGGLKLAQLAARRRHDAIS